MADFGDYGHDVVFDFGVASHLTSVFRDAAREVDAYGRAASIAREIGGREFRGFYARVFDRNMLVCQADAGDLGEALRGAAECVEFLSSEARKENQRRRQVREYLARHDDWWEKGLDAILGQEAPPPFSPDVLPSRSLPSVSIGARCQQGPALVGGGGGVSSAVPENLDRAAGALSRAQDGITRLLVLGGAVSEFQERCRYGRLKVGDLVGLVRRWWDLNRNDIDWLDSIAMAFRRAGGSGRVPVLSDYVLAEALQQSRIRQSRDDLDISAPSLSGIDPKTGYVEDPVNTATGSFVEPEADIACRGAAGSLALTRLYHSASALNQLQGGERAPRVGVFGIGWASILDQHLIVGDGEVTWVRGDGRHIVFLAGDSGDTDPADFQGGGGVCGAWRA